MEFLHVLVKIRWRLKSQRQREVVRELSNGAKWAALAKLLLRPWWRRVWTLQEYIIPPEFTFLCGTKSIGRNDFKVATHSVNLCRQIDDTLLKLQTFQPAWNRRRLYMWRLETNPMPLFALIVYGSDGKATDPRDRIYSVLGLAKDRAVGEPPDYNSNVDKIYSQLVRSFVETHKSLDISCFIHLFNRYNVKLAIQPALPSWVPDWRAMPEAFVVPVMASQSARSHVGNFRPTDRIKLNGEATFYAPAGNVRMDVTFLDDPGILICKGILLGYVDGIGGLKVAGRGEDGNQEYPEEVYDCVNSTSPVNIPMGLVAKDQYSRYNEIDPVESSKLVDDISRCLVLDRKDRYLSYQTPPKHFYLDFQAFCLSAIERSLNSQSPFHDWFLLSKSLFIRHRSLEELCRAAEMQAFSERRLKEYRERSGNTSFLSRFKDTTESMARRLITTNKGHIGMVPCRVWKGDRICVLFGRSIPMILRQRGEGSSYEVIGECYLHGFMDGEALEGLNNRRFTVEAFNFLDELRRLYMRSWGVTLPFLFHTKRIFTNTKQHTNITSVEHED